MADNTLGEDQPITEAEWVLIFRVCDGNNPGPVGPNAWLCRLALFTLYVGQPFDTDAAIAEHMDWLNKSENAEARSNLVGCINFIRRAMAKPRPEWQLPDDAFDPTTWNVMLNPRWEIRGPGSFKVERWLPDETPEPPRRAAKWDGRPFPGRCTWTHPTTGQQCDNQAISSFGYWDGGAPGAGRWVQSGACLDHSGSTE